METTFPASANLSGLKKIAQGGSGVVFVARHELWGNVAVKAGLDNSPEIKNIFIKEYNLLRSLKHAGILKLYDFGMADNDIPFTIMELLPGGNLYSYTDSLKPRDRFRVFGRILSAIRYLHDLGIVHRDLKGDNILLGDTGKATITDLGLAAGGESDATGRGGTVEYMAPEVIDNKGATPASDIYSLGVILFRIATGELPFQSNDPLQVISRKQKPGELDFTNLEKSISMRFSDMVRRALEPDPANRFRSITEISEQLLADGLLQKSDLLAPELDDYFHHHVWSYTASFVRQELKTLPTDATIVTHKQGIESGLLDAVADFLKTSGYTVTAENERLNYSRKLDGERTKSINIVASIGSTAGDAVDYPELDEFAQNAILEKLFHEGTTPEISKTLYRFSNGNLKLLKILLTHCQEQGFLDPEAGKFTLSPVQLYNFTPPDNYFDGVGEMAPPLGEQYTPVIALLATDRFDNDRQVLVMAGKLTPDAIEELVSLRILDAKSHLFSRSYMREYYYRKLERSQQKQAHKDWAIILDHLHDLDDIDRDKQIFYHFYSADSAVDAIEVAVRLADKLTEEQLAKQAIEYTLLAKTMTLSPNCWALRIRLGLKSADLLRDSGDLNQALAEYALVVKLASRFGDRESLADAYKNLGDVYKGKRDYRRGNRALDKAVNLYGELGNELELSHCFNNIGNIYWINGDLDKAEINYETALEVQRRLNAKKDVASSLNNLGTIKCIRLRMSDGVELYKEALAIKRELKDYPEIARTANNIAVAYFMMDELQTAKEYLDESFRINQTMQAEKELLYNFENYYEVEVRRGNLAQTKQWLYSGLRMSKKDDYSHRGVFTAALAEVFLIEGNYGKAANLLAAAQRCENSVTDKPLSMRVAATYAEYYRLLFDFKNVEHYLAQGLELAEKIGEKKVKAGLLILKSRVDRKQGVENSEILKTYDEVENVLAELPVKREKYSLLLEKAEFLLMDDSIGGEQEALIRLRAFPEFDGKNTFQPQLNYICGLNEFRRENYRAAVSLLHDATLAAKTLSAKEWIWKTLAGLGDCYEAVHEYEKALRSYIEAFSILKELASGIQDQELKRFYFSDREKIEVAEKLEELTAIAT